MPTSQTNQLLGYPSDARLLILNADDFGMYEAINEAVVRALKEGVVRSTTLMTPCPRASQAMDLLKVNLDIPFGVHLTVICDIPTYRYGPLAPRELTSSLIEDDGCFYRLERMQDFLAQAKLNEFEIEFRAQIEAVLSAGLKPTHLDWHCLNSGGRADVFDMSVGLAKEYGLAIRVGGQPYIEQMQRQGLPANDHNLLDSFAVETAGKTARYVQMLRDLPVGLSEWAVHPGLDTAEAQLIDPDGWPVRNADFNFLISQAAKDTIEEEGIVLLDYRALQEVWNAK
jgi:chitin disaccharide deacetylase